MGLSPAQLGLVVAGLGLVALVVLVRTLPVTDWLHERLLCIPLYFDLPDARIDAIAQLIRASSIRAHPAEARAVRPGIHCVHSLAYR